MVTLVIHNQKHSEADIYAATNALLSKIREVLMGLSVFIKIPTIHSAIIALDILVEEFERTGKYSVSIDLILGDLVLLNQEITGLYAKNGNISEQKEYKKYIDSIQAYIEFILENNRHFNVAQLSLIAQIFPNATAQYALRSRNAALIVMSTPDIYHRFERPSDVARIYYKHKYDYELASLVAHNVPAAINFELALNANHELKAARESVALLAGLKGNSEQRARTYLHFLTKAEGANPQETKVFRKRNLDELIKKGKKLDRLPWQVMDFKEKIQVLALLDPDIKAQAVKPLMTPPTGLQKLADSTSWLGRGLRRLGWKESAYKTHQALVTKLREKFDCYKAGSQSQQDKIKLMRDISESFPDFDSSTVAPLQGTMPFELWSLLAAAIEQKERIQKAVVKAKVEEAKRIEEEAKAEAKRVAQVNPVSKLQQVAPSYKAKLETINPEEPHQFSFEESITQPTVLSAKVTSSAEVTSSPQAASSAQATSNSVDVTFTRDTIVINLVNETFSKDSDATIVSESENISLEGGSPMQNSGEFADLMTITQRHTTQTSVSPMSTSSSSSSANPSSSNPTSQSLPVPYGVKQAFFKSNESRVSANASSGLPSSAPKI